jgi:hypothetical protein
LYFPYLPSSYFTSFIFSYLRKRERRKVTDLLLSFKNYMGAKRTFFIEQYTKNYLLKTSSFSLIIFTAQNKKTMQRSARVTFLRSPIKL